MQPLRLGLCVGLVVIPALSFAAQGMDSPKSDAASQYDLPTCQKMTAFRRSVEALGKADIAIEVGDYQLALHLVDSAIDKLGLQYQYIGANDDTGVALVIAEAELRRGNLSGALKMKKGILESRTAQYCFKLKQNLSR